MNDYFATFNCRDEDQKKAKDEFIDAFDKETYTEKIKPYLKKGIMSIFEDESTPETMYYVKRLAFHVNSRG